MLSFELFWVSIEIIGHIHGIFNERKLIILE